MSAVPCRLMRRGVLNLPRSSPESKPVAEAILLKDALEYHCFFREPELHNHLSHHVLAAYDLGATPSLLQKMYNDEAPKQRSIILNKDDMKIGVTTDNWTEYLGNEHAYYGYLNFFQERIKSVGVPDTLEKYIFSPLANKSSVGMLVRLMSGIVHPFIQIGYGLEFGSDLLVATGLAQTAVHQPHPAVIYDYNPSITDPDNNTKRSGPSVLELLREVYDSALLKPVPYDGSAILSTRIKDAVGDGRGEEIQRICSRFQIADNATEEEMNEKIKEFIWAAVLLLFSTGKEGHKPRLDFFLMHLVTSSIFLKTYVGVIRDTANKAQLLRAYLSTIILFVMVRGRPRINANLTMHASDKVRPPLPTEVPYKVDETSIGSPAQDDDYTPWPAFIEASLYASDSHVLKTMRTLIYAAREYGDIPAEDVIGVYQKGTHQETHLGMAKVDGSLFVRAAGVLMNCMGWTTHGQVAGDWDRSALGWEEAWLDEESL
ncbi:hypothetical protein VNI00_012778 [Paramarasmius palmivorus]|uniref:Uncharacterized protein n=1 Tax=Paramarasmius palmivorus TaxID=297713 RepID=A0AAW0C427_9AGAR